MDKDFATDCKPVEYALMVVAPCIVGGVGYAAGDSIRTAKERVVRYLVESGVAKVLGEVVELTPEEQEQAVTAVEVPAPVVPAPKRVTRSKKRKQG